MKKPVKNNKIKHNHKIDLTLEKEIQSETKFLWILFKQVILTPWILLLVLFKQKKISELLLPFKIIFNFIFSAKFTAQIIILNILIYIFQIFFMNENLFLSLANVPTNLFSLKIHTLITSGFLHGSISHLFWNMLGIFLFGRIVERKLKYWKTCYIYFGALIISNIFSSLVEYFIFANNVPGIGASGALMGLVATAILLDPFYITHDLLIPLPSMLVGWIFIFQDFVSALNQVDDNVGHFAHIGGFLSISIIYFFMNKKHKDSLKKGLKINVISGIIFLVIYGIFVIFLKK